MTLLLFLSFENLFAQERTNNDELKRKVTKLSEMYFHDILTGEINSAYKFIGPSLKVYISDPEFKRNKNEFRLLAKEILKLQISKITIYEDPLNSPMPGTYIAADYLNSYTGVPFHCGYLIWFRANTGDEFKIIREETGFVTEKQLAKIPEEQLNKMKQGLRCIEP